MTFTLADINSGPSKLPPRLIVYGVPGVGKSTFAAYAPSPIIIQTENGLGSINVPHFPQAKSVQDVKQQIEVLKNADHQYKTVVFDSLDWYEGLVWDKVARDANVADVSSIPYGRGYAMALDYWRELIEDMNWLRDHKGMTVIYTAHSDVVKFIDPEKGEYNRYGLKLHKNASPLLVEDVDAILFANYQVTLASDKTKFGAETKRALGQGVRVVNTREKPAATAKNRYNLMPEIVIPEGDNQWSALWNELAAKVPYYQLLKEGKAPENKPVSDEIPY